MMKKNTRCVILLLCLMMLFTALVGCNDAEPTKEELREKYFSQEKIDIVGSSDDLNSWIYQLKDSGIMVREAVFDSGKGGEPVTISQITDLHFNYCNKEDIINGSDALLSTYDNRKWLANGESVPNAVSCLEMASAADQMVITGDVLDYLSLGAMELMQEHIWDKYPDALVCLGNHESVFVCQGTVPDETTLEYKLGILEDFWIHDMYYTSKIVGEKVMVIQLDNGTNNRFWGFQAELLEADIELAREKGYIILIFYHIPIATGDVDAGKISPLRVNSNTERDFSTFGNSHKTKDDSNKVYNLIVNNADVIKGAFCGHLHSDYYTEIIAKNSDGTDAVIPQYILTGTPYDKGHVMWITVK